MANVSSINGNVFNLKSITLSASDYISSEIVIKAVRNGYKYVNGTSTGEVECINYEVVNPVTYDRFTIKVPGVKAIVTNEQLQTAPADVYAKLPIEHVQLSLYSERNKEGKYTGKVKISITSPAIVLINKQQAGK